MTLKLAMKAKANLMSYKLCIKILLSILIILFLYSLVNREIDIDDAWLAEHAYWLQKQGYVKSELMRGITNQQERLICHHKLHTIQGSLIIKLFGLSHYLLKSINLVFLLLFIYLVYIYLPHGKNKNILFLIFLSLLFSSYMILKYSFIYRPEIQIMCFGFFSFYLLDKYISDNKINAWFLILSGCTAGLCGSLHLNGIIYPMAGFFLLLARKKILNSLVFAFSSLAGIAIYFFDFTSKYNISYWYHQINDSPFVNKREHKIVVEYILSITKEHLRYFHSYQEIGLTLLFAGTFIFSYKSLSGYKNLITYLFLLMIFLGLVSVSKTSSQYLLLLLPFMLLIVVFSLEYFVNVNFQVNFGKKIIAAKTFSRILMTIFIIYFSFNSIASFNVIFKNKILKNNELVNAGNQISGRKDTLNIIAPMNFIFNNIESFKTIQSDWLYERNNKNLKGGEFIGFMSKNNIHYAIFDTSHYRIFGLDTAFINSNYLKGYSLIYKNSAYFLLNKQPLSSRPKDGAYYK